MTDADVFEAREWDALRRIHVELGGPKPPENVLARHMGEQTPEQAIHAADTLRAERANRRAEIARRLMVAALAIGRRDLALKLRDIIRGFGQVVKRGKRRGPQYRVWRASDTHVGAQGVPVGALRAGEGTGSDANLSGFPEARPRVATARCGS